MEVDTGSAVSIVSEVENKKWFKHLKLQPTQFHLQTCCGEYLPLYQDSGNATTSGGRSRKKPVLLGCNWLEELNLDWSTIFKVSHMPAVEDILAKYEALFVKGYGHIKLY